MTANESTLHANYGPVDLKVLFQTLPQMGGDHRPTAWVEGVLTAKVDPHKSLSE